MEHNEIEPEDMPESDLQEEEERLYAQVYHDSNIKMDPLVNFDDSQEISSSKSNVRYWQQNTSLPKRQNQNHKFNNASKKRNFQKFQKDVKSNEEIANEAKSSEPAEAAKKFFVPYSSVLTPFVAPAEVTEKSSSESSNVNDQVRAATNYEKKSKITKFPKDKKFDRVAHKQMMKSKYEAKVVKAEKVKLKSEKKQQVDSIAIESSSEDEVILVPLKPPPIINLDSSEDEEGTIKKKKKRAASPSSISMISDDFIVSGDRSRLNNPLTDYGQQSNDINERLVEVLSEKEKLKKIKNLTKISSSSSNSARSSCERSVTKEKSSREKVKSKRKTVEESPDTSIDTIYTSKIKSTKKKKVQSESSDEGEVVQKASNKSHKKRRKSSSSRKKSTDEKKANDEEDKDPKLELISNAIKVQKKKCSSETVEIEKSKEVINPTKTVVQEFVAQKDVEIVVPIVEITDDDEDSDDSMKNFKANVECDISLNVTKSSSIPHKLDFIPEDVNRSFPNQELDCEVGWNDEMKHFYNECSYGRDFSLSTILNAMPTNPKFWQVNHADRVRMYSDHEKKIRCRNCNEMGHIAVNCKRPKKRIVCFMCGENNHRETRCPNSICLRCGKPNRVFATMCSSCHSTNKSVCPICNYKGHTLEQCPDKWRRYHSTTGVDREDLSVGFTINTRVYCSICAKKGHFAENCSQFNKAISGLITSNPIVFTSSKSSYIKNYSFNATVENEQVLQLVTYIDYCYKFNFKLPSNCELFPRYREMFKAHQFGMFTKLQAIQEAPKKRKREKREKSKNKSTITSEESKKENEGFVQEDTNSNYSFTDFYVENKNQNGTVVAAAMDFIPLQETRMIENRIPSPIEKPADAKIMLTKEHASILLSSKGQNLVYDLSVRFNVTSQFNWDSTGNSLIIQGLLRNQENFQEEIRGFLYKAEMEDLFNRLEKSTQAPRIRLQVINYLQSNLNMIKKVSIKETKKALQSLIGAERELDHKKTIKFRRSLNIIFMGFGQIRQGGFHVGELRKILFEQKREVDHGHGDVTIDQKLRDEINRHIRYIFSATDHGNYRQMFEDFQKSIQQRDDKKLLENPILRR